MSKLVYFMRPVGHIGPIKIGCSKEPQGRLEAMSIVSPLRLEIVAAVPGTLSDEARLHGMFQAHWLHHEWFSATKELLALVDYVIANGALPDLPQVLPFKRPLRRKAHERRQSPVRKPRGPGAAAIAFANRIAPLYTAGARVEEIAEAQGCTVSQVRYGLRVAGVQMRKKGIPAGPVGVTDVQRAEEFKRRYLAGETLQQIGDDHGVTRERVRQVLRKFGVDSLGHRPELNRGPLPLTPEEISAARAYEAGTPPREIRKLHAGITLQRLHRAIARLGIPRRPRGSWLTLPDDAERTKAVAALYRQGLSAPEILLRLPWLRHPETVYRYLKKAGVNARCEKGWGKRWKHKIEPQGRAA